MAVLAIMIFIFRGCGGYFHDCEFYHLFLLLFCDSGRYLEILGNKAPDARADAKGYWGEVFDVVLILVVLVLSVLSKL